MQKNAFYLYLGDSLAQTIDIVGMCCETDSSFVND